MLGKDYLAGMEEDEIIFRTPGLRFDVPALAAARKRGAVVTSEMELFFELCPCPIFGVTGSDGKTTTLVYEMLSAQGFRCHKGGNIGAPLLPEIANIKPTDIAVVELSSFQLHDMHCSPDVAVITNLSPNHLDYHTDMQEYIDAKKNIFLHQTPNNRLGRTTDSNPVSRDLIARKRPRRPSRSPSAAGPTAACCCAAASSTMWTASATSRCSTWAISASPARTMWKTTWPPSAR